MVSASHQKSSKKTNNLLGVTLEAERVMLVSDPGMVQFGYADLLERHWNLTATDRQ